MSGDASAPTSSAIENPPEISHRDHPNSCSSGSMYSPNDQNESPAASATETTEAASTHQP